MWGPRNAYPISPSRPHRPTGRDIDETSEGSRLDAKNPPQGVTIASEFTLVEGFFSKMARSVLRHIRVASKAELKSRILAYLDGVNSEPVIHTWTYKIGEAA